MSNEGKADSKKKSTPPDPLDQLTKLREALAPQAKPLEGTTTLGDNVPVESAILAYDSLSRIGDEIATALRTKNVKQIVLLNPPDLAGFHDLKWIEARVEVIRRMFEDVKPPKPAKELAAAGVAAAIGTVSVLATTLMDLYSWFRVDVNIKSFDLTLEEAALVSELAGRLSRETTLFYPAVLPLDLSSPEALTKSEIRGKLDQLYEAQQAAESRAANPEDKALVAAKAAFDSLRDDLFKVDATAGTTLLARIIRAELLASLLKKGGRLLYLKIAKAGGSQKTEHSRLRGKDTIFYSGGAVVTYILFAEDGSIAAGQTLYLHSGFREFAEEDEGKFRRDNF